MRKAILPVLMGFLFALLLLPGPVRADEAVVSYVDATSWIVGRNPESYMPKNMIDGNETTSYQFSTLETPLGQQYITFHFREPSAIDSLWIKNGFWRYTDGYDQYTRNCRVRKMTVDYLYENSYTFMDPQTMVLPDDQARLDWTKVSLSTRDRVIAVRFRIDDMYTGTVFSNDVCISEVKFVKGTDSGRVLYGLALQKLATRNGPGTQYDETGTYFVAGQYIRILSRAWDSRNDIWWVKCEIPYRNEVRVLWTGYKRFDSSSLPLESIPIEGSGSSAIPTAVPSRNDGYPSSYTSWQDAYRRLISSGTYLNDIRCVETSFLESFNTRDHRLTRFALHDMDRDRIPELIVETCYGLEQCDVFRFTGNTAQWAGTMGGNNFINEVFFLTDQRYPSLFVSLGGPAQRIVSYSISYGRLFSQDVGSTIMNSEGDTAVGFSMTSYDNVLYTCLYNHLVAWPPEELPTLRWFGAADLQTDSGWYSFCGSATGIL